MDFSHEERQKLARFLSASGPWSGQRRRQRDDKRDTRRARLYLFAIALTLLAAGLWGVLLEWRIL